MVTVEATSREIPMTDRPADITIGRDDFAQVSGNRDLAVTSQALDLYRLQPGLNPKLAVFGAVPALFLASKGATPIQQALFGAGGFLLGVIAYYGAQRVGWIQA